MGIFERPDDKPILFVVYKIAPEVIYHDSIIFIVVLWKFAPQKCKRLALKETCMQDKASFKAPLWEKVK